MIYRRKTYKVDHSIVNEFNRHFNENLLPTQVKYGARLVGRWMRKESDEVTEIFAMWEYDSHEQCEEIEAKVRSDEAHMKCVQAWYEKIGRENIKYLFKEIKKEEFFENTVIRK
ncbi:NIPSNAP family protein [Bacillus manliponensis]|uniref:NIPSNAP family protein n=1 Tax=Bacillus manliponensis TaxID=574376 RepID=UPI003514BF03